MTQLPLYLGAGCDTAMCLFHEPPRGVEPGAGVVLCPPLGWDEVASYRMRRRWAEELAASGHPTLRFDLPSTGDSTGSPKDPARLDAWTAAIAAAASWLRTRGGCPRVTLVGLGVGGLLACRALDHGAPADDLVLWGTPSRGRAAVRELRALSRLEAAEFDVPEGEHPIASGDGGLEVAGFAFTAETVAALGALDVAELELGAPGRERRALLLQRDGLRVDAGLRDRLEACGLAVTEAPGDGWSAMTPSELPEAQLPTAVVATVAAWLADAAGEGTAAPTPPVVTPELTLPELGVRELPFTLARPYGRMFGILAEPTEPPADNPDVIAVLLNAGAVRRTGPNRLWVEVARRWAARGVVTLRLDLEGIGDADGDEGRYADVGQMYEPHLVDETAMALRALGENRPDARFVLVGLCSGAYWAFHAARRVPEVAAVVMLNPRQLFYDPAIDVRREAQRAGRGVVSASRWRRVLGGHVSAELVLRLGRSAAVSVVQRRAYQRVLHRTARELERGLDELRDQGDAALLMFSEGEPLLEELREEHVFDHLDRWPTLELEIIRGPGHTFRPVWSQRRVHDRIDRALEDVLGAADSGGVRDEPLGAVSRVGG